MTNPLKYSCLFGGGAIRGIAYIGVIRALEELNIEYDIIAGSSVGSIFATLIACGYKSYELENIFLKVNFDLFKDIHLGIGKNFGISKGEIFIEWINELISKKISLKNNSCNFEKLNKKLVIITTNLTKFQSQEFSLEATPQFEVAKAIRISSSMPGLMPIYEYEKSYLVDGDLQKASPMWQLSDTINNSQSRILEFRLEGDFNSNNKTPLGLINNIYSCVTDIASDFVKKIYGDNDRFDCIKIYTGDFFFADFNLNKDERRKLIEKGYEQTIKYFKEFLPQKKSKLLDIYTPISEYLKNAYKGLKANNVEEVQWWLGDIFTIMCENKEIIDPNIYQLILKTKNELMQNTSKLFFFRNCFKNIKKIEQTLKSTINTIDCRITDLKLFLQAINIEKNNDNNVKENVIDTKD